MTAPVGTPVGRTVRPHPTRHREAEARGARLGRPLRLAARLSARPDEALLDRIGDALRQRDEAGARLAVALRRPAGDPERVTRDEVAAAFAAGAAAAGAPSPLADFMALVTATPAWVDLDRVDAGARAFGRLGTTSGDVLTQLSLIGGYRFGGPTDLLVATGGLTGESTKRRLAETQEWVLAVTRPGGLRPGAEGWRSTLVVRVMHAMVEAAFEEDGRWDVERWGLPINQADQAGTLGLFDATVILGCRVLGVPVSRRDAADLMHLWRYVGWLMGVDDDFLTDDERERHRFNQHILLTAAGQTDAGRRLARDIVAVQTDREWGLRWAWLDRLRGHYERERLLSMLTAFLGRQSMHDLGLPVRPPWGTVQRVVANTWRHRLRYRGAAGRDALERIGRAEQERGVATYARAGGADRAGDANGATAAAAR